MTVFSFKKNLIGLMLPRVFILSNVSGDERMVSVLIYERRSGCTVYTSGKTEYSGNLKISFHELCLNQ